MMETDKLTYVRIVSIVHRNPDAILHDNFHDSDIPAKDVLETLTSMVRVGMPTSTLNEEAANYHVKSFNGGKDDQSIPWEQRKGGF